MKWGGMRVDLHRTGLRGREGGEGRRGELPGRAGWWPGRPGGGCLGAGGLSGKIATRPAFVWGRNPSFRAGRPGY